MTTTLPEALAVVGVDHRGAALEWREDAIARAIPPGQLPGVAEVIGLGTCDRVAWIGIETEPGSLRRAFDARVGRIEPTIDVCGEAALTHLFEVAAGMASHVLGEPEILGQLKHAHREAVAAGTAGPLLETVLAASYSAGARVRHETSLGTRPVSLASAAAQIAAEVFGDLGPVPGLLIGGADIGLALAERLRLAGLQRWHVAARHTALAADLARSLAATIAAYDPLAATLERTDVVISAVGSGRCLIDRATLARIQRQRRYRPLYLIDAAMPADIDAAVSDLDGVFLYTLDDLERLAAAGRVGRQEALAPAQRIVEEQVRAFRAALTARAAAPAVTALRRHAEALRQQALADAPDDAAEATRRLLARLLHRPSEALRAGDPALEAALSRLFGLTEE